MGLDEKEIDLSGCGLTKLPKRVLEFHSLTSLNLKDNMIDFIPPALSSLQSIQTLQLEGFFPSPFSPFLLSSLFTFPNTGNPLSLCSLEGLNSASDVLAELKKTVEMRTEKWVHMKVVYLGNPGVGKTSVARAIAGTTHSVFFFFLLNFSLSLNQSISINFLILFFFFSLVLEDSIRQCK